MFVWLMGLCLILFLIYAFGKLKYNGRKGKGIKFIEPRIPFIGAAIDVILQRKHLLDVVKEHYNEFPDQKYFGIFEGTKLLVVFKDLQLIKQVGVKDFDHFHDHRSFIDEEADPIFGNMLFVLKGEKWRDMRATLSPAFTSSKIKNMFLFVQECSENVIKYLEKKTEDPNYKDVIHVDAKTIFSHYTNDVIASTAFGLNIESISDEKNNFFNNVKEACDFGGAKLFKVFMYGFFPRFMKFLDIPVVNPTMKAFFTDIVQGTMNRREKNGIVRHDMIHLLMEAKKGSLQYEESMNNTSSQVEFATVEESAIGKRTVKRVWTDDELTAQAFLFFLGGYETTSTILSWLIYELARNPDVQKKLQDEIDDFNSANQGKVSFTDLPKLKYLDMVVSESLRMWPPLVIIDRMCTKPYTLPPSTDGSDIQYTISRGDAIWFPIYAIHHDPKYYPNPERFDPERFSDENKSSIDMNAYLPFGIGPRNCVGSRFALMVVKSIVFYVVSKFEVVATAETQIPPVVSKKTVNLHSDNGIKVGLKPRSI